VNPSPCYNTQASSAGKDKMRSLIRAFDTSSAMYPLAYAQLQKQLIRAARNDVSVAASRRLEDDKHCFSHQCTNTFLYSKDTHWFGFTWHICGATSKYPLISSISYRSLLRWVNTTVSAEVSRVAAYACRFRKWSSEGSCDMWFVLESYALQRSCSLIWKHVEDNGAADSQPLFLDKVNI
jgi:hypothetical protein